MKIETDDYVTIGHAAKLADVTRHWMRQLAKTDQRLGGVEIDGQWFVLRAAAEAFERHPSAGRPRESAPKKRRK